MMLISSCIFTVMILKNFSTGQPRRHLLTTGWSVFVSSKKLVAGDAFIFLRQVYLLKTKFFCTRQDSLQFADIFLLDYLCSFYELFIFPEVKTESCVWELGDS